MSQAAVALGELLDSDRVIDSSTSYLVGQLAFELVSAASEQELRELIVAAEEPDPSDDADEDAAASSRRTLLAMLSGFLEGLLGDKRRAATAESPRTVRERVLNLVAIGPRNPSELSVEIGCSLAAASRALSQLRRQGLVEATSDESDLGDKRYNFYQLTAQGEERQDAHFLGRLTDEAEVSSDDADDEAYQIGLILEHMERLIAELGKHDPETVNRLWPALSRLKAKVESPAQGVEVARA